MTHLLLDVLVVLDCIGIDGVDAEAVVDVVDVVGMELVFIKCGSVIVVSIENCVSTEKHVPTKSAKTIAVIHVSLNFIG